MAVRATCIDEKNTLHLLIGFNRNNIEALLRGEALICPRGPAVQLTAASDVVIVFGETYEEIVAEQQMRLAKL